MKSAFIVIVDYGSEEFRPWIGDIHWSILGQHWFEQVGWDVHTTNLTPEMLRRHRLVDHVFTDAELRRVMLAAIEVAYPHDNGFLDQVMFDAIIAAAEAER